MPDAYDNDGLYVSSVHPKALKEAQRGYAVFSGLAVAAQGSPDMTVNVPEGYLRLGNKILYSAGNASLAVNAAHATLDRYDLVSVNSSGTVVYTAGTAAADAKPPEIPSNNVPLAVLYIPAASTTVTNAAIYDLRIIDQAVQIGGDGSDGTLNVAAGTTNVSGFKQYTSVTVASGATLNIQGHTIILSQSDITINGNITSDSNTAGPGAQNGQNGIIRGGHGGFYGHEHLRYQYRRVALGGGRGGDGGSGHRGVTHGAPTVQDCYGFEGGGGGGGAGARSGGDGEDGTTDDTSTSSGGTPGTGGSPKFGLVLEAYRDIIFGTTASVNLAGGNATTGSTKSGGGGGAGASALLMLALRDLTLRGTFTLTGGNGANGMNGGGSGAGGLLKGWYGRTLTDTATKNVAAGSAGSGGGTGQNGVAETTELKLPLSLG